VHKINKIRQFDQHILQQAAACVPSVPSIACSTADALAWDESFRNNADPSGRAVSDVHDSKKVNVA
jgi:asparagine synthase (glutamine-hydrolysing)